MTDILCLYWVSGAYFLITTYRSGVSVPEGPRRGAPVALSRYTYPSHKGVSVPALPSTDGSRAGQRYRDLAERNSGTEALKGGTVSPKFLYGIVPVPGPGMVCSW